jgi:hypothetical protein
MTALGPQPKEAGFQQHRLGIAAVRRGSLGMNFDCGGQNLLAQCRRALFISQGLQKEFDCLADIDKRLLNRLALRLAPLQFGAPRVVACSSCSITTLTLPVIDHHSTAGGSHRDVPGPSRAARWTRLSLG